jgi:hypothetical protein
MGTAPRKTSNEPARFTNSLRIRCPESLPAAIDTAAARNLMTASEYVRRSIIARLKADGIEPAQLVRAIGPDNASAESGRALARQRHGDV